MGCMKLCESFHITPEPGQGLRAIVPHSSSPSLRVCLAQCEYTIGFIIVSLFAVHV